MKTQWDQEYVWRLVDKERKFANATEWCRAKQITFESATGVKWDFYSAHGHFVFCPILDWKKIDAAGDDPQLNYVWTMVDKRRGTLLGQVGFLKLSEETKIGLTELMPIVKRLLQEGCLSADVDRMGGLAAVKSVKAVR